MQNHFNDILSAIGLFEQSPALAVAVSGGSDSMAMLLLVHDWAKQHGGKAIALTVDHGLRQESAREATQVAAWCQSLDIEHHTLVWKGPKPSAGKQEAARNARYSLLTAWCRNNDIQHLFTAHHLEDQGETLFFRLARGSFIKGLAGIPMVSMLDGIRLIRPLLGNTKQELQDYLKERKQPWLEDPSNQSMAYTRNIIRNNLAGTDISIRAGVIANCFGTIRNILENKIVSQLTNVVLIDDAGFIRLDKTAFLALPEIMAIEALSFALKSVSGTDTHIRTEQLQTLHKHLQHEQDFRKRNLTGCIIGYHKKKDCFLINREPAATTPPTAFTRDTKALWDRFEVHFSSVQEEEPTLTVGALGADGLAYIDRSTLPKQYMALPAYIFYAFPAFWRLEELVAVPHIKYVNPKYAHLQCFAHFIPAKALAAPAFYGMSNSKNCKESA
ncbi:MAG: tRNA lysidine(34) synthetase TilS [Alphaproteobacteria bacterium]